MKPALTVRFLMLLSLLCLVQTGWPDELKYHDKDLICDEARVPAYDLPPLLVSAEGRPITTAEEWFKIRRPQIISLFANLLYGTVPESESPLNRIVPTTTKTVEWKLEFTDL